MWEAIRYVATPASLIAFIAAVTAYVLWRQLGERRKLIESASSKERASLIEAALETYHLKEDNLTREQKFQLVKKVIDSRANRLRAVTKTCAFVAALMFLAVLVVSVADVMRPRPQGNVPSPSTQPEANKAEAEALRMIIAQHQKVIDLYDQRLKVTEQNGEAKDRLIADLRGAISRVAVQAQQGSLQATAALQEARQTGNPAKAEIVLEGVRAKMLREYSNIASQPPEVLDGYLSVLTELASVALIQHKNADAQRHLTELVRLAPSDSLAIGALADLKLDAGDLDGAESLANYLLKTSPEFPNRESSGYRRLGQVLLMRGSLAPAEERFKTALAVDQRRKWVPGELADLALIATALQRAGKFEEAWRRYEEVMDLMLAHNLILVVTVSKAFDEFHEISGQNPEAAKAYRWGLERVRGGRLEAGVASELNNAALLYDDASDMKRAEALCLSSLEINTRIGRKEGMAANYGNLGMIYKKMERYADAERYLQLAVGIYTQTNSPGGLATCYLNLGTVAAVQTKAKESRDYLVRARALFLQVGDTENAQTAQHLVDIIPAHLLRD